jgi:hypothetical protein
MSRNRVFDQVMPGFFFLYFFSTRPGSNLESTRQAV